MRRHPLVTKFILFLYVLGATNASNYVDTLLNNYNQTCQSFSKTENSTVIFRVQGRLGNQMLIYAMMMSLKEAFGFKVFMEKDVLDNLNYYFPNVGTNYISDMESSLCDFQSFPWISYSLTPLWFGRDKQLQSNKAIELPIKLRLMHGNVMRGLRWDTIMDPIENKIRRTFTLRPKFVAKATSIITKVANDYKSKVQAKKRKKVKVKMTFIGIHLRKSDSEHLIVRHYNLPKLLSSYYLSAMDFFHEKFKHPVFLLIGDNMDWGRANIMNRAPKSAIYPVGSNLINDQESIGIDLAVLANCNHTILSYGTFSFWAGFLSGGKRAIPHLVFHRKALDKNHPLDVDLPPFALTDYGLFYMTDEEKRSLK